MTKHNINLFLPARYAACQIVSQFYSYFRLQVCIICAIAPQSVVGCFTAGVAAYESNALYAEQKRGSRRLG